ncbi:MAG: radical SAM protein [Actinomycetota bacterium]|nr:radical SAM protein [Actinomycetota bacterium]
MASLADLQRAPGAAAPAGPAALPLRVQRARTFDTPGFAGMTFLEVEVKSALNRVEGMPFPWSINPYRGCSHACSYCMSGETAILMADGRTKPLADIRPGDAVYGTERRGARRRFVLTRVLDHWSTVRPAYRVTLEDGTELVTSGDHRFLTRRGWRHVVGAGPGRAPRPHLTLDDQLVGSGGLTGKGLLAGSFDAEGGLRDGSLRSRAGDEALVDQATSGRRTVGVRSVPETHQDGGRGRAAVEADAAVGVVAIERLGLELPLFDITTGTGDFIANGVVSHNCFARPTHAYLNLSPLGDFERTIVVKTNLVEVLRRELARPSWRGEHVAMGTNTDPYQRCEGRYRLMPGIIAALAEARTPLSILTKGTLITRDAAVLRQAAERAPVAAALTVGLLDETLWREIEPGTPSPRARLEAVRALNAAGIPTGVMVAPIMPGLNDGGDHLTAVIDGAAAAGAVHITPIVLHLRPGVREVFWPWLERHHPELLDRYTSLYTRSTAPRTYREGIEGFVAARRGDAWARHGTPAPARGRRSADGDGADRQVGPGRRRGAARHGAEQLRLL